MRNNNSILNISLAILLVIVSIITVNGQSQKTWQWLNQLGGKGWDITSGIAADSKNNIYIAGSYALGLECQGKEVKSNGNHDMYIARFNDDGNLKWITGNGGAKLDRINSIATYINDNIIVAGVITDSIKLGDVKITGRSAKMFIAMLDEKGKYVWIKTINYSSSASLYLLDTDIEGNIYAGGVFKDKITIADNELTSKGKTDVFILKLDAAGNIINVVSYGGEGDEYINALEIDNDGNIISAGNFASSFIIDSLSLNFQNTGQNNSAYIIRFNGDLRANWVKTLKGEEYLKIASVKIDINNNMLIAGNFNRGFEFGISKFFSNGRTDAFLIKLSSIGDIIWAKQFGSEYYDYLNNMSIDNLNGAYITGSFSDTIQFDSIALCSSASSSDAFIAQISSGGNVTWATKISGTGNNFSKGAILDGKGNLYITGSFKNKLVQNNKEIESLGEEDIFLAKYYNCPENELEIENTAPLCPGGSGELFVERGYKDIIWNDTIPGSNRLAINKPGKYWVRMIDKRGCLVTDTAIIQQENTAEFSLGNDTILSVNDSIILNCPNGFIHYCWQDYSGNRSYLAKATDLQPGIYEYWVCATDSSGCQVSDTISIKYIDNTIWIDLSGDVTIITYPNPANDWLYWYINTDNTGKLLLELIDEKGSVIYNEIIEEYLPGEIKQINMYGIPSGAYYFNIASNNDKKTIKILHDQKN